MTIVTMRKDIKGDLTMHDNVKKVIDHGKYYELWINENWQVIVSKEYNKVMLVD